MTVHPIHGEPMLIAAAKGSVGPERLSPLLDRVQSVLADREADYRRRFELATETSDAALFFVEPDHWATLGEELGLNDREVDAVRRAHETHVLFDARRNDRRQEVETALEVREVVVVGTG